MKKGASIHECFQLNDGWELSKNDKIINTDHPPRYDSG